MPIPPGQEVQQNIQAWSQEVEKRIKATEDKLSNTAVSTIVVLAPLTGGGTEGKLVFSNGILIAVTPAT